MNNIKGDVLAVMDELRATYESRAMPFPRRERVDEARAAVTEMIEKSDAMMRFLELHQYLDRNGDVRAFRAALARVGGCK